MIEVLNQYTNPERQGDVLESVQRYYDEACRLMPELPKSIGLYFYDGVIVTGYASGGFGYGPTTMTLGFDDAFPDEVQKWNQLRGTVFHESFHLVQGFTAHDANGSERPRPSAIDEAISEGAATVFEREYAGSKPGWSEYLEDETMLKWLGEIKGLGSEYDISTWKFYDPETDRKWILYRTGVLIVDKALMRSGLDILDLRHKSADEILKLAEL